MLYYQLLLLSHLHCKFKCCLQTGWHMKTNYIFHIHERKSDVVDGLFGSPTRTCVDKWIELMCILLNNYYIARYGNVCCEKYIRVREQRAVFAAPDLLIVGAKTTQKFLFLCFHLQINRLDNTAHTVFVCLWSSAYALKGWVLILWL